MKPHTIKALEENRDKQDYFRAALSNFTFDVASGGAIRHLADLGYTTEQIRKRLDFPTPYDRIQQAVWEHFLTIGILRLEEPGTAKQQENYEYIAEYDAYGRKSFRRVTLNTVKDEPILWKEQVFSENKGEDLSSCLSRRCAEDGEETAYVSCDFGLRSRRDPKRYQEILALLEEEDREYVQGLPWERKLIYHRLNRRMRNIIVSLHKGGAFTGVCYFMKRNEKLLFVFNGI